MSAYDRIARIYDPWSVSVTEDVGFYVDLAKEAGSVVELGVGTGRIAVPTAAAGVPVIGVDSSSGMLEVCAEAAAAAGVAKLVDLRLGDLADPPVSERVPLVTCPFRAYLHLHTDEERLAALAAAHRLLVPGGRFAFDVFAPGPDDVAETHGRWLDTERRRLTLSVRGSEDATTMELAWLSPQEWRALIEQAGFEVLGHYGWFDRRPYRGGEDSIWIGRRPTG